MKSTISKLSLLTVILISALAAAPLQAQDIRSSNLSWTVTYLKDLSGTFGKNYSCVFNTSPSKILWVQKNGTLTTPITIQSATGAWNDVTSMGTVTYQIIIDGLAGTMIFERNQEGVFITLDLSTNPDGLKHRYTVSSIQPQ